MKLSELRKAAQILPEDDLWALFELYETFMSRGEDDDTDHGRYGAKIDVLDAEFKRRENPNHRDRVDVKLAKSPNFWEKM